MKHSHLIMPGLIMLGLAPASVLAQQASLELDQEKLESAIPLGEVLGDEVVADDGRVLGELEDVLLAESDRIKEYLVRRRDPGEQYNRGATEFADDVVDYEEPPLHESESQAGELELEYTAASASDLKLDDENDTAVLDLDARDFSTLPQRDARQFADHEAIRGSDLIGMEVDLEDKDSFGSIEEVMLSSDGGEVVAYVVDNWEGLDKQRRALPASEAVIDREREVVIYHATQREVQALPEFERERSSRKPWDQ